jgi:SecD/SecF fusion protein
MQNLHWKLLLIFVILGLAVFAINTQGVRLGKDLQGGLSLTYQVTMDENEPDPQRVLGQVIDVVKRRLNPQGLIDLSVIAQGRDRIELITPLPSEEVKALERQYRAIFRRIVDSARIPAAELDLALRAGNAVERFGGSEDSAAAQRQRLQRLQDAFHGREMAATAYAQASAADPPDAAAVAEAEQALAEAEIEYDTLRAEVIRFSIRERDLRRVLELSNDPIVSTAADGTRTEGASPRQIELESLRAQFPHLADDLDEMVALYDDYRSMRRGFDDPEDVMRLMRGAGVLEFRIAVQTGEQVGVPIATLREDLAEKGPIFRSSNDVLWLPINDLKQWYKEEAQLRSLQADPVAYFAGRGLEAAVYDGRYYLLIWDRFDKKMTHESGAAKWQLAAAFPESDSLGRPAVGFRLDDAGGLQMARLTGPHVNHPMAIVLDGEVYSAPNLNSQIASRGVIEGNFTQQELDYLMRVLASGSLEARLSREPIAVNQIGPSIGRDNLERGLWACVISIIAISLFMMVYYFYAGVIADVALMANGLLVFGIMALNNASFTMGGIAGVVLSLGMAVDANVLIYERMREEMFAGEKDIRQIVRLGYSKALSTIIDGNVTTLIVCLALYWTATPEIKGFALTLGIGLVASMFTALFVTRVIFTLLIEVFGMRRLPMLVTAFPTVHRTLFQPKVNWIGLRHVFMVVSIVAVIGSWALVFSRGEEMLDTEFRGGLSMTMRTAPQGADVDDAATGPRVMLERADVERRLRAIGAAAPDGSPLRSFQFASVLTAGENQDGTRADMFQIKVAVDAENAAVNDEIVNAIVDEFEQELAATPPYAFADAGAALPPPRATFPITKPALGAVLDVAGHAEDVSLFNGGVAVVVSEIDPPARLADVRERIDRMRRQSKYLATAERTYDVFGLDAAPSGEGFSSIAVVVLDEDYPFEANPAVWQTQMAELEWRLVTEALAEPAQLEQVSSFSSAVASTLAANAGVAIVLSLLGILVYIWIRFGSFFYSAAAVVPIIHDASISLGLIALSGYLAQTGIGRALGIDDFRIDINVVAAVLTIIGYSLNDTIVTLDRIRENRGKKIFATARILNDSVNQTMSRTILTAGTTFIATLVLYIEGGTGVRPFAYCLLMGVVIGTYSTIAIAAPIIYRKKYDQPPPGADPVLTGGNSGGMLQAAG